MKFCISLVPTQKQYIIDLLSKRYNTKLVSPQEKERIKGIILRIISSLKSRQRTFFRNWAVAFFGLGEIEDILPAEYVKRVKQDIWRKERKNKKESKSKSID